MGLMPDKKAEGLQSGRLGERRKGQNCIFLFHMSRILEMWTVSSVDAVAIAFEALGNVNTGPHAEATLGIDGKRS
jgi:hypothetical protein